MDQISSNLLKKAFETSQLKDSMPLFPLAQPCTEIKILRYALHVSFNFFHLSFFSFSYLFAAVIDLPLGLLPVHLYSEKASSRWAIYTMECPCEVTGNFALNFLLQFLNIFMDISCSIESITLICRS